MAEKKNKKVEKKETAKERRYFYAVGRRKTAVAKVKLFPSKGAKSLLKINEKGIASYFPLKRLAETVKMPLNVIGKDVHFDVEIKLFGGGNTAQSEAARLGIARALVIFDKTFKKVLKSEGFLTRDSREVERKKPGLKKARRAPQWAKR
ncbi:MAG TPA: 30S ribosomal protein S9 [Candidatus Moranbacteria bacterium]|nr:30S ribosomal protein S9 [Candidatus Moranbacteria bacterium]